MISECYYVGEFSMQPDLQIAFLPLWLLVIIFSWLLFTILVMTTPNEKTKKVVILGSIAAGKTTLWNQLKGLGYKEEHVQTSQSQIDSFKIQGKNHEVTIESTKDIGGGDSFVRYYDELIQEGTFVYFLIDLNRMNETRREVRARLQKIFKIVAEKKFKDCGLKILATHFDEYTQKKKCSKDQAKNDIMELMEFDKIKGKDKIDFSKLILAVNLLDAKDIEIIKNEICALKK